MKTHEIAVKTRTTGGEMATLCTVKRDLPTSTDEIIREYGDAVLVEFFNITLTDRLRKLARDAFAEDHDPQAVVSGYTPTVTTPTDRAKSKVEKLLEGLDADERARVIANLTGPASE